MNNSYTYIHIYIKKKKNGVPHSQELFLKPFMYLKNTFGSN